MAQEISRFRLNPQALSSAKLLAAMATIYDMPKVGFRPSREVLRDNLLLIHETIDPKVRPDNSSALAERVGMPQRTIYSVLKGDADPFSVLDELAGKLGVHPWQLLYPVGDKNMIRLLRAYNEASAEGRLVIEIAVKGVEAEIAEKKPPKEGTGPA